MNLDLGVLKNISINRLIKEGPELREKLKDELKGRDRQGEPLLRDAWQQLDLWAGTKWESEQWWENIVVKEGLTPTQTSEYFDSAAYSWYKWVISAPERLQEMIERGKLTNQDRVELLGMILNEHQEDKVGIDLIKKTMEFELTPEGLKDESLIRASGFYRFVSQGAINLILIWTSKGMRPWLAGEIVSRWHGEWVAFEKHAGRESWGKEVWQHMARKNPDGFIAAIEHGLVLSKEEAARVLGTAERQVREAVIKQIGQKGAGYAGHSNSNLKGRRNSGRGRAAS